LTPVEDAADVSVAVDAAKIERDRERDRLSVCYINMSSYYLFRRRTNGT